MKKTMMAAAFVMAALASFAQQDTTTVTVIHSGDGKHESDTIRIGSMTIIKNGDGSHKVNRGLINTMQAVAGWRRVF
jgi:hypothetical protein